MERIRVDGESMRERDGGTASVRPPTPRRRALAALLIAFAIEVLARMVSAFSDAPDFVPKSISLVALFVLALSGFFLVFSLRGMPQVKWFMVIAAALFIISQLVSLLLEVPGLTSDPGINLRFVIRGEVQGLLLVTGLIAMLAAFYMALVEMLLIQDRLIGEGKRLERHIHERERAQAQLAESHRRIRQLTAYVEEARETERTRIAREIHDDLGQTLASLRLNIYQLEGALKKESGFREQAKILARLDDMSETLGTTVASVRRIIAELRPGVLDDLGLFAAAEWQTTEFERRFGVRCNLKVENGCVEVDSERSTALFRILQEALTNVARHANAHSVTVRFAAAGDHIELQVTDDGVGIAEVADVNKTSFGLLGMQERVLQFDGRCTIDSAPGEGTRVIVSLPVGREPKEEGAVSS